MVLTSILGFLGGVISPPSIEVIPDEDKGFLQEYGAIVILAVIMIVAFIVIRQK